MAHDYNNLLMAILMNADLIRDELPEAGRAREYVEEIRTAARRNVDLTRQLLAFARQHEVKSRTVRVDRVVRDVQAMVLRLIGEDIAVEVTLPGLVWPVLADPVQLEQVLINMAVNARDAMPDGGRLEIWAENADVDESGARDLDELEPGSYVIIHLRDSGHGIPEEILGTIFEPFFTTKSEEQGTGLGLSTCYGIVRGFGGAIRVRSDGSRGTQFSILLPRHADTDAIEATLGSDEPEIDVRGTETVLIVEDEPSVRTVSARILKKQGYVVVESCNGQEALRYARDEDGYFDVMLTDVVMPEMSGHELIQQLREFRPDARVVCMSGYVPNPEKLRESLGGATRFLTKPCPPQLLLRTIRELLDH